MRQILPSLVVSLLVACQTAESALPSRPPQLEAASPKTESSAPPDSPPLTSLAFSTPSPGNTNSFPSTLPTSPIDGMPQVFVPAGTFRMGGLDIYADDRDEFPAHMVSLDAFWVDQLEVTNAMYMLCVQAGGCSPPENWASDRRQSYFNNLEYKDYPVVQVTWEQANTYCEWAKRRLPTEAEWERAARGDDFRTFPWGDEPANETYAQFSQPSGDTSRVGSYPAGASPFGALDMAGNVWEWVADYYAPQYYINSPERNPTGPQNNTTSLRVIRGGSFQDEWFNIRVSKRGSELGPNPSAAYSAPDRDGRHSSKIGFRCVSSD